MHLLRQSLDAHQQGRVLSAALLEDYGKHLDSVLASQKRMRKLVGTWWTIVGADQAH